MFLDAQGRKREGFVEVAMWVAREIAGYVWEEVRRQRRYNAVDGYEATIVADCASGTVIEIEFNRIDAGLPPELGLSC